MHKLSKKPAGTSSAQGQAVNINTTNNNRGRGGGNTTNSNNNNKRGNSTNRGNTNINNSNRNNSNSSRGNINNNTRSNTSGRGKVNNNNSSKNNNSNRANNNKRGKRGKGKRGESKRGGHNNKNINSNRNNNNDESDEEESSTYSTDEQSHQPSEDSDSDDYGAIHSLPGDFYDFDELAQRFIWHGPAPVCSSRTAYHSSPFKLDHYFASWQKVDEHFDMPWPPPLQIRCKSFNLDQITQAFNAVELDIKRWENILVELWEQQHVFDDNEPSLVLLWAITRLQYLRALYPVMDANKYDFDMRSYYAYAVIIMNIKGPDYTAVVDFMSRKKEGAQEDSSVYFDKWFENNTHFGKLHKGRSTSAQKSAAKHNIETPQDTPAHKKTKTDTTLTVVPPPAIPKATQGAATTPTTKRISAAANTPSPNPLTLGISTPAAVPPPPQTTLKLTSQNATRLTPLTPTTAHSIPPPKLTHQLSPKSQIPVTPTTQCTAGQSISSKTAPQRTRTSPRNKPLQTTPAQPTASHPLTHVDEEKSGVEQELEEYTVQALKDSAPMPPVTQSTREVKRGHTQYHNLVTSVSPKQQSSPLNKVDTSPVSPVPEQTRSTKAPFQNQPQQQPPPVEQGRQPLNKEVADKKVAVSTDVVLPSYNWMENTPMGLDPDNVVHQEQQQQQAKPSGGVLSAINKDAEKITGAIVTKDDNPLQDPQDITMVASQPDVVLSLGPQVHYHRPQLQQAKEPQPVATTMAAMAITAAAAAATAEINIPSPLQDLKSWMETETKKHQDQSALLQSLLAKSALLESKLEAHTARWDDEVKQQEAHRSLPTVTHSCEFDLASLKERTLAQDLKISQLEAHLESRIRHSLEHDLAVVRNDLQEERFDNLTKDLEIKRAEAVDAMARARAEMRDARQMVAEAREARANAMERAARAEADNQMLLRVINELQGTGWRVSGQAQAQGRQGQDAGIHHTGLLSSSVHSRPQIDHPHYPFTTTAAGSSTFMRFGASMRQSYSSSSTESLASAGAGGAVATDPSIHRMEVISVKSENDYIARLNDVIPNPDLDPDMTEDDEGRTDTDHDATDEE